MKRTSLAASTLLLLSGMGTAPGQDQWEQHARTQLGELGKTAGLEGYELEQKILTGRLRQRRFTDHTVTLDAGTDYAVIATCDNDCGDVDLRLFSGTAIEIDSDVERDEFPVVEVAPPRTTIYQVRVIMAQCAENPCRYGVGIFAKSGAG